MISAVHVAQADVIGLSAPCLCDMSHQTIGARLEIADPASDLLGRGGMGDVCRGTDLQVGDLVAIKALWPAVVSGIPDAMAPFTREGEALREACFPVF